MALYYPPTKPTRFDDKSLAEVDERSKCDHDFRYRVRSDNRGFVKSCTKCGKDLLI